MIIVTVSEFCSQYHLTTNRASSSHFQSASEVELWLHLPGDRLFVDNVMSSLITYELKVTYCKLSSFTEKIPMWRIFFSYKRLFGYASGYVVCL